MRLNKIDVKLVIKLTPVVSWIFLLNNSYNMYKQMLDGYWLQVRIIDSN
jgi:hypothetical protein